MRTHDELIAKQGYYYNLYMSKEENNVPKLYSVLYEKFEGDKNI